MFLLSVSLNNFYNKTYKCPRVCIMFQDSNNVILGGLYAFFVCVREQQPSVSQCSTLGQLCVINTKMPILHSARLACDQEVPKSTPTLGVLSRSSLTPSTRFTQENQSVCVHMYMH